MKKHNLPLARIMMRTLRFVGCFLILPTLCAATEISFDYPPPAEQERFIAEMAPLDPIKYLSKLKMPKLLQFVADDEHVSKVRADALAAAAPEPKTVRTYSAKHDLNAEATRERVAWLQQQLKIESK